MTHDPLLQFEQHTHTKKISIQVHIFRAIKLISLYFALTGAIFTVLMGILNFSAYSAVVTNWVNPDLLLNQQAGIEGALTNSNMIVHAAETIDSRDSLEAITQKVVLTDPDIVYARSYDSDRLLSGVSRSSSSANFAVTPYENRIVIPKLGKNIPLVDVDHDLNAKYSEMQNIFMEELKKGVVRYPGTARPGEAGNAFIFGHSSNYPWVASDYNDVFALLNTLETNDEIIVYYNQKKYIYRVTDRSIVLPGDTDVLSSRDPTKKEISLMTCWPVGTALERYIIFGELVETL